MTQLTPEETNAVLAHLDHISEFRINKVKIWNLKKRFHHRDMQDGWRLHIEGPVGGHCFNFATGFLYFNNEDVHVNTGNLQEALKFMTLISDSIKDHEYQVVRPADLFISKYLNPEAFEKLAQFWVENGIIKDKSEIIRG